MTPAQKTINRVIFICSLMGVSMALYVLQSFLRQSSILCLTGDGCSMVRKHPASYPFGIPVPLFGLVGYLGLTILSFLRTVKEHRSYLSWMLGISIFGICFVSWFTVMELFVIHGICMWCLLSAVNMFVIFGFIMYTIKHSEPKKTKN